MGHLAETLHREKILTIERRKEGSPKHVTSVLAVCHGSEATVLLDLDNILDALILYRLKSFGTLLLLLDGMALIQ